MTDLKSVFVIQDVKTKEYFWQYRIEEGFNANITEATTFNSEEDAVKQMQEEYLEDLFDTRILEVRKFYGI
jgi:hypothetical protein